MRKFLLRIYKLNLPLYFPLANSEYKSNQLPISTNFI
jgi:hypothetical protein